MSTTMSDEDLEQLLRATFRTQASDVDHGPQWTGATASTRRRWVAPLIAAAVVLGLVATLLIVRASQSSTPPSVSPPVTPGVDLTSFAVPGYDVGAMMWTTDYRAVAVRKQGAGNASQADAIVFDLGSRRYDYSGFRSQGHITVEGKPGMRGQAPALPENADGIVTTIVWNYAPWHWAVVQSVAGQDPPPNAELMRIAASAQLSGHLNVATPFRFSALPAGFRLVLAERRIAERVTILQLRDGRGTTLDVASGPFDSRQNLPRAPGTITHGKVLLAVHETAAGRGAIPRLGGPEARFLRRHVVWQRTALTQVVP